ncbi:unnamed protein product [Dovyalis caffra]|uniref:Uncharacterized protein n=1 Tax=Dovyalis caffra TaxID=77055 RepID=A0AAV1RFM0_9ROSI|nr:unnamed protein product [Dovyalis caffra]
MLCPIIDENYDSDSEQSNCSEALNCQVDQTRDSKETTATVLTAALVSKKPEPPSSGSSDIGSSGQGSSSGTIVPSLSIDRRIQSSEETINNLDDKTSSKSLDVQKSQTVGDERSTCPTEEDMKLPTSSITNSDSTIADHTTSGAEDAWSSCPRKDYWILDNNKTINVSSDVLSYFGGSANSSSSG